MSLKISPLEGFEWECGYGAIVTVAKYFNCNYQLAFKDLWKFDYIETQNKDVSLGSLIATEQKEIIESLHNYCNFEVIDLCVFNVDQVVSIIKEELHLGKPVKLRMDLYWCPWNKDAYKRVHVPHSFLIIGFDEKSNVFNFIDHSPIVSNGIMKISDLPNNSEYTISTFKKHDKNLEQFNWLLSIKECCNRIYGKTDSDNIFELQRKFSKRILDVANFNLEYSHNEKFLQTELYKNLIRIIQNRNLYSLYLKFISEKYKLPKLLNVANSMNLVADEWTKVKNVFAKASMLEDPKAILIRVSQRVEKVSAFEEQVAKELLDFIKSIHYESC